MKFYFIRHATTEANLSGSMVKNYNSYDILPFDDQSWWKNIRDRVPYAHEVNVSPTLRCEHTANILFPYANVNIRQELKEFDCSGIGDEKFWEMTESQFEKKVKLSWKDMYSQTHNMFRHLCKDREVTDKIVCISHGMFIRYVYWYINSQYKVSPYKVINSIDFDFKNLDVLEVEYDPYNDTGIVLQVIRSPNYFKSLKANIT